MENKKITEFEYQSIKAERLLTDIQKLNEKFQSTEYYDAPLKEKTDAIDETARAHESILREFALKIIPSHYVEVETESGATPSQVEIVIEDLDLFFDKLKTLSQENLTPDLARLLKGAASGLLYEITRIGNFETTDFPPDFLAKMENMTAFTEEYHMIDPKNKWGFNDYLKPLEQYLTAYKAGYLQDLLYIENNGLGGTLEGWEKNWGPLKWHQSGDVKSYRLNWTRAAKILEEIKKNPQADKFRIDLIKQFLFAINRAELYVRSDLKPTEKDAYLAVLLEAKKKLKGMI